MGIHQLSKLLGDNAPSAMKENEIKNYFGRKIAIDASMSIYQFLIAVRADGSQLTNEQGETTSHLMGMFYRTIRMVDNGIKPLYVFDGKPPEMKSGELAKRSERRAEAQKQLEAANETGDAETVEKFSRRLVKVTPAHNEECKKLLTLMGIPYVDAPCEAEAQCAELVKGGKVYATATEDMDSLTFGSSIVLRHLTFSEARKMPIQEYHLDQVLSGLELSQEEFIDLCILLGCDYCNSIKGIGPKKAITLIKQHKHIEEVIKNLDKSKYPIPEDWKFKESRELFKNPEVTPAAEIELKWSDPDEEGLIKFMCEEKGFNEDRIRNGSKKLGKARHSSTQGRLDSFFKVIPSSTPPVKRKQNDKASKGPASKKAKGAGGKFGRR
ncbi:flap endonuclease 1-like [Rhopilema esculentum]|uniref:flap endonuclease 1-like n=1 Tax=Rhopilema esculentum TaxID=499914 RepID=UPI0031D8ECE2|eukprot:gene1222-15591_t